MTNRELFRRAGVIRRYCERILDQMNLIEQEHPAGERFVELLKEEGGGLLIDAEGYARDALEGRETFCESYKP